MHKQRRIVTEGPPSNSKHQGPVVQSIVSLTNLLMTHSLTVVAKVFSNIDIFARKKCKSYSHFSAKISMYLPYFKIEILTSH